MRKWLLTALWALLFAISANAQSNTEAPAKQQTRSERIEARIRFFFGALQNAPSAEVARYVEGEIQKIWIHSDSDTINLLMSHAQAALQAKDLDLALAKIDAAIAWDESRAVGRNTYFEGRNQRAIIYFAKQDFERALRDINFVIKHEPRHFVARAGRGMILAEFGLEKAALEDFEIALVLNPRIEKIPDIAAQLRKKLEGTPI